MELVVPVTVCISFIMLLLLPAPCVSEEMQKLPRKLIPVEEATGMRGVAEPELKNYHGGHTISPGVEHGGVHVHGTWREWMEGDSSQYYTADYAFRRRRRPIHNKSSLPRHAVP